MRETINIIKSYLLNGVFAYALFGIYSLTAAPIVTQYINYGDKNLFIALFGFTMLIAEFFALNFKLKMVRIRAQEKRLAYKKETGKDIIPTSNALVFYAFFMRLVFHVVILMVCINALGFPCTEKIMSPQGVAILMVGLFADFGGFIYIYMAADFYTDPPGSRQDLNEELKEEDDWDRINLPLADTARYFRLELISDIVLQVYALMLFTSVWKYINQTGIDMLDEMYKVHESAVGAAVVLIPMLLFFVILGLMPMRIAYWIEDTLEAFTQREKLGTRITFIIAGIFSYSPSIIKYVRIFILHLPNVIGESSSDYISNLISILLFLVILSVQVILFWKKK